MVTNQKLKGKSKCAIFMDIRLFVDEIKDKYELEVIL